MLDLTVPRPLEPVKLPNGRVLDARPLDPERWELLRETQRTGDPDKALAVLRWVLPDATDEDLGTLGEHHVAALLLHVQDKVTAALAVLGNSAGTTAAASTSPPSSPSPTLSTS